MNILDAVLQAGGGKAVNQIGAQVGLGEAQTASALSALVPALAAGFQQNLQSPEGLSSLTSLLANGGHQQYIENPAALATPDATDEGNRILSQVLGSKDVSRDVASRAAAQSGVSADVLKRLLPLAATLMMGAFAQKSAGAGLAGGAGGGGIAAMLTPLLDRNRDGSIADDVSGMLGNFLKRS